MVSSDNQDPGPVGHRAICTAVDEATECEHRREIAMSSGSDDETDGRLPFDWKSRYEQKARVEIRYETIYLFFLLFIAFSFSFFTWNTVVPSFLSLTDAETIVFNKYIYYSMAALLGGVVFTYKNLYKYVARGWWHQDRRTWRLISPIIGLVVGFVVGAMVESNMLSSTSPISNPGRISVGFISGYFADRAIGKMREIAAVVFGTSSSSKKDEKKEQKK